MTKNQIMSFNTGRGFDSRLIVFLNYQSIFLVFSKAQIDVYDASLTHTMTFASVRTCIIASRRAQSTQIIGTRTSRTSRPTKTSSSATTRTSLARGRSICLI